MSLAGQEHTKDSFYESFAGEFDEQVNMYDTLKRVRIVFDELLPGSLSGKTVLDCGCGTGWFSQRAEQRGARVVSLDVGVNLLKQAAKKSASAKVAGTAIQLCFHDGAFDIVVTSEMLEHTPDPKTAFRELARVLKPGGILVLTTPNRVWHWSVVVANALRLRPYAGHENWVRWSDLRRWSEENGLRISVLRGFHIIPFQWSALHPLIDFFDRFGRGPLGRLMINTALVAEKVG
jgi:ubiquinone biosynthesis O-methyltransferase